MINNKVKDLLICPSSKRPLCYSLNTDSLSDEVSPSSKVYSIAKNRPILIDFENSVVNPEDFDRTIIERSQFYQNKIPFIKHLVSPDYSKTKRNFDKVISILQELGSVVNILIIGGGTLGKHIDTFMKIAG
jgi:hypothetical protein